MAVAPSAPVSARERHTTTGWQRPDPYRFPRQPRQPPDPRQPRHPLKILHRLGASWGFSRDASLFPASLRLALRPPARKLRGLRQGEPRRPLCPPAAALRVRAGAQAHPVLISRTLAVRPEPAAPRGYALPLGCLSVRPARRGRRIACGSFRQVSLYYSLDPPTRPYQKQNGRRYHVARRKDSADPRIKGLSTPPPSSSDIPALSARPPPARPSAPSVS